MTTTATTQTPYRMNFTSKFSPVEMRVSRAPRRRIPWVAGIGAFVLASVVVATGVAVYSVPKLGPRSHTPMDMKSLHAVAEAWRANHGNECPTPQRLKEEKELAASSSLVDVWGSPYLIGCNDDTTIAMSFGPDKTAGTADDIVFPNTRAPQ